VIRRAERSGIAHPKSTARLDSGLQNASAARRRAARAASLSIWIAALVCDRLLALVYD
jgi:hypothetical protein